MGSTFTFKQFLESRRQLEEHLKKSPIHTATHTVTKYCKFPIGEKISKDYISLKPGSKVIVEWQYDENNNPLASKIDFDKCENIQTYWSNDKIYSWILNNTSN